MQGNTSGLLPTLQLQTFQNTKMQETAASGPALRLQEEAKDPNKTELA